MHWNTSEVQYLRCIYRQTMKQSKQDYTSGVCF